MGPEHRLAVYGTLAPGQANHDQLAPLTGRWMPGIVNGHLHSQGWGAPLGFPAIVLDDGAPEVRVQVFVSTDLPEHWERLDRFEGPGYRRRIVAVTTDEGTIGANIYTLAAGCAPTMDAT